MTETGLPLAISLGDIKEFDYIKMTGGTPLQPTVEIPASELWLFQNREALKAVQIGLKDASEGKIVKVEPDKL